MFGGLLTWRLQVKLFGLDVVSSLSLEIFCEEVKTKQLATSSHIEHSEIYVQPGSKLIIINV